MHHLCKTCRGEDLRMVELQTARWRSVLPILTIIPIRIVWSDRCKELSLCYIIPCLPQLCEWGWKYVRGEASWRCSLLKNTSPVGGTLPPLHSPRMVDLV